MLWADVMCWGNYNECFMHPKYVPHKNSNCKILLPIDTQLMVKLTCTYTLCADPGPPFEWVWKVGPGEDMVTSPPLGLYTSTRVRELAADSGSI